MPKNITAGLLKPTLFVGLGALLMSACVVEETDVGRSDHELGFFFGGFFAFGGHTSGNFDRNSGYWDSNAQAFFNPSDPSAPNFANNGGQYNPQTGTFTPQVAPADPNDATYLGDSSFGGAPEADVGVYTRATVAHLVADQSPGRVAPCGSATGYCDMNGVAVTPASMVGFTKNIFRPDGSIRARRPAFYRTDINAWEVIGPGESFTLAMLAKNGWDRAFRVLVRITFQGFYTKTFPDGTKMRTEWPLYYVQYAYPETFPSGPQVCPVTQCPFTQRWKGAYTYFSRPLLPPAAPRASGGQFALGDGWQTQTMPFGAMGGHQPGLFGKTVTGGDIVPNETVLGQSAQGQCNLSSSQLWSAFALAYGNGFETTTNTGVPGHKSVSATFFLTQTGQAVTAAAFPCNGMGTLAYADGSALPLSPGAFDNSNSLGNVSGFTPSTATALSGASIEHGANFKREQAFQAKNPNSIARQAITQRFNNAIGKLGAHNSYNQAIKSAASTSCKSQNRALNTIVAFAPQGQVLQSNGASSTVLASCNPAQTIGRCDPIWYYETHQNNCGDGICDFFVGENQCGQHCAADCGSTCIPGAGYGGGADDEYGQGQGSWLTDDEVGDLLDGDGAYGPNDDDDYEIDGDSYNTKLAVD